jgi:hypothetical protein
MQLLSETFLIKRRTERYMIKNVCLSSYSMYSTHQSYHIWMKLELSRHTFATYSTPNFQENPYSGKGVVPCGRTDRPTNRNDQVKSRFSQFYQRPWQCTVNIFTLPTSRRSVIFSVQYSAAVFILGLRRRQSIKLIRLHNWLVSWPSYLHVLMLSWAR